MDSLFSELPYDMVEVVLSFIPTPDLCRYRTVSKGWNELISNLNFAVVHAENHAKLCSDAVSFIVLHYNRCRIPMIQTRIFDYGPWCILDVNARRWYRVEDKWHRGVPFEPNSPIAIDCGLVCQLLRTECYDDIALIVRNPIGNFAKRLPLVPKHETSAEDYPGLSLVFDMIAKTFKAYVINHSYDKTIKLDDPKTSEEERLRIQSDPVVRVYDSVTDKWQSLGNPAWDINSIVGYLCGSLIFQGHLVLLFSDRNPGQPGESLWTYSLAEKTWKIIPGDDMIDRYDPKLVVSANRLFLVTWYQRSTDDRWWFSLEEIKIPEITLERVYDLRDEEVVSLFELRRSGVSMIYPRFRERLEMSVIGFGKSSLMVVSNSSHKFKVFDVLTRSWNAHHDLPQNPLGQLKDFGDCEWVGKHMNLLLRNWQLKEFNPVSFKSVAC